MNGAPATVITDALLRNWPLPSLENSEGKEDRGRVIVIGGARHLPGGALLAGEAVLRAGAGKLHIATAAHSQVAMGIAVPEARVSAIKEDAAGNLLQIYPDLDRELGTVDAILVGPGMETGSASARLVRQIARVCRCPLVLDAGALDGFRRSPRLTRGRIITPHFGEMARLLELPIEEIQQHAAELARELARETNAVVVLKSPVTFVAAPEGECWVNTGGSIGLGTSGSGDVLAGLITGLVARGAELAQAAVWGVRMHALAGEVLTARSGPVGFLAREISPVVPSLLLQLDTSPA